MTTVTCETVDRLKELVDRRIAIQREIAKGLPRDELGLCATIDLIRAERPHEPALNALRQEAAAIAMELQDEAAMLEVYCEVLERHGSRVAGHLESLWDGVRNWTV